MISFHKSWLFIIGSAFALGLILGIVWRLPSDQTANLAFLMAGLLVGVIGVAATLWASSREREFRFEEIRTAISETRSSVTALREMAAQVWQPEISTHAERQPRGIALAVSETVGQAIEGIAEDLDETITRRMEPYASAGAANDGEIDLGELKHGLQADVREYASSLAGEIQLMIRVAQLTVLTPVQRFLVKELTDGPARVNEWGATADPRKTGFSLSALGPAKEQLIGIGVVEAQPAGNQAVVKLAEGWTEAVSQYESMYGPTFPSLQQPKEIRLPELAVSPNGSRSII